MTIHGWSAGLGLWIALILLPAAVAGARAPRELADYIDAYRVLPAGAGRRLAPVLVSGQMLAALLIATSATRVAGAMLTVSLLLAFNVAIAWNILRDTTDFDCGCTGPHHIRPGPALLLRNAVLLLAALAVAVSPASPYDVWQCVIAGLLLLAWHVATALIAAAQWPGDD